MQAHDVRRAAGAVEPDAAAARVVLLEVVLAALQRVDVEEPLALGGDRGREAVVEHALHVVGVLRVAGGEQQPPAPLEAGDGGAGLVVGAVRAAARTGRRSPRQRAGTRCRRSGRSWRPPCRPSGAPRTRAARGRRSRRRHRSRPPPGTARGPRARPRCPLPHRQVVLQVAAAQAGVPGQAVAALVDELAGQVEVGGGAGLAVELGQRGLDDRVPVEALAPGRRTRAPGDRPAGRRRRAAGRPRRRGAARSRPGSGGRRSTSRGSRRAWCTAARRSTWK